uniref:Uncharacterized protein n=1 Tax=Aegilops tauschii subsp. strangulata TaxID=200361 RepID=A0A453DI45_AEGTS
GRTARASLPACLLATPFLPPVAVMICMEISGPSSK